MTRRVLIVGAKFGEIYLNAFLQVHSGMVLVGLLAQGSARAQQLAHAFGIALYSRVEQLPDGIDIACVVVRSTVVGGRGTTLALALLARGIHVIQEHPLHPDDIERLQQAARQYGCCYWVNSFYVHTAAGRRWIAHARRIRERLDDTPAGFAQLVTSRQLLYSSLDLLLQATESSAEIAIELLAADDPDFHLLRLALPGCKVLLRLQSYLDPEDPDLHSLIMHQLTLGWRSGYLTLAASYGPLLWTSVFYDQQHRRPRHDSGSLYRSGSSALEQPPVLILHPAPLDWRHALEVDGATAVLEILQLLCGHLDGAPLPPAFNDRYQYQLARLWQRILRYVGAAQERRLSAPLLLDAQSFNADAA